VKISTWRSYYGKNDFSNCRQQSMKISARTKTTPGEDPEAIPSPRFVWFFLRFYWGAIQGYFCHFHYIPSNDNLDVTNFCNSIKAECPNTLASVDPNAVKIYKNKAAFDGGKVQPAKRTLLQPD
jgi:hypothetical protein